MVVVAVGSGEARIVRHHTLGPHRVTEQAMPVQDDFLAAYLQVYRSAKKLIQSEISLMDTHVVVVSLLVGALGLQGKAYGPTSHSTPTVTLTTPIGCWPCN